MRPSSAASLVVLAGCAPAPCADGFVRTATGACDPAAPYVTDTGTAGPRHSYAELPTSDDVDVLIVGGGPAGLAAARAASEAGATVRLFERDLGVGGSANLAGGLMMFSGSPEQAAAGITDSPAQLASEWASFTGGDPTDPWFQFFAAHNVDMVHDWLAGFGLAWIAPGPDPSGGTTWRVQLTTGGGAALVHALHTQLAETDIRLGATVDDLAFDDAGRVIGVAWTDAATGVPARALGRATVVATGGFAHDLERVLRERPDLPADRLTWASWEGADGGGLTLLEGYGAATENLSAIGLYAHGTYVPDHPSEEAGLPLLAETVWVDAAGERFCDESQTNSFLVGETRATLPGEDAWALFDATLASSAVVVAPDGQAYPLDALEAAGLAVEGGSITALATALEADPAKLQSSVDAYNRWVDGGEDAYRTEGEPGVALRTPPFYAVGVAASVAKNFGGVSVDLSGRVLDVTGQPIPGLYAAGELTGMLGGSIVGEWGFTGSLTAVVLGGRVAGMGAGRE